MSALQAKHGITPIFFLFFEFMLGFCLMEEEYMERILQMI